jgi:hypothetical protein
MEVANLRTLREGKENPASSSEIGKPQTSAARGSPFLVNLADQHVHAAAVAFVVRSASAMPVGINPVVKVTDCPTLLASQQTASCLSELCAGHGHKSSL